MLSGFKVNFTIKFGLNMINCCGVTNNWKNNTSILSHYRVNC